MSNDQQSQAERVARAMKAKGLDFEAELAKFSDRQALALKYNWEYWARPSQMIPKGDWEVWLILAGRGFGKTRSGAEWIRSCAENGNPATDRFSLVARTVSDVRDVMVEGESGILAVSRPDFMPTYEPSKRRLTWPNGIIGTTFSADKPDQLRGPQSSKAWCDEHASWRYPESWDMLTLGNRLGDLPQICDTTTPRPTPAIKDLVKDEHCIISRGSTYENRANLADAFFNRITRQYEGTRLGRQEIYAEVLDDNPNALWQRDSIQDARRKEHPQLQYLVVAVDPSITDTETSSEAGIVAAGLGIDGAFYVLADASLKGSPNKWGTEAVAQYHKSRADVIVYESNQGGDMVGFTLSTIDPRVPLQAVHASRGKRTRAEPIAALYEQGRVHHVGVFSELEDQMCEWVPGDPSPDRLDALVWAITAIITNAAPRQVRYNPLEQFGDILPTIG